MPEIKPARLKLTTLAALAGCFVTLLACLLYASELSQLESLSFFAGNRIAGGDWLQFWAAARLTLFGDPEGAYRGDALTAAIALVRHYAWYMIYSPTYYPPTYLLVLAPFGIPEYIYSHLLFFVVTLGVFLLAIWQITRQVWFVLFMLAFSGIWLNLVSGQNGLLTAGLFGLGLATMRKNASAGGIFFGLLSFKPHLGFMLPLALAAGRHWRTFFFAAVTVIGFAALTLIIFGPFVWIDFFRTSTLASAVFASNEKLMSRMPGVFTSLRLLGLPMGTAMLLHWALVTPAILATLWVWARSKNFNIKAMALCACTLLSLPFLYDYDMGLLGIGLAFLALEIQRTRWWDPERLIFPLLMCWPVLLNRISFSIYAQLGLIGPLLLLGIALRRAWLETQATDGRDDLTS